MHKVAALMRIDALALALFVMAVPSAVHGQRQDRVAELNLARGSMSTGALGADFGAATPSAGARRLADWVAITRDSGGAPFAIVDKPSALLYMFDGQARLLAASPVLLGSALGDENAPGIGDRPIALVRPEERTTPAGRFVAERGRNARGEDVVWVDYDAAVSMHRVITSNKSERRLERLATPTAADNRISYGCINVPVTFYESHVRPAFARESGIIYVMPDVASLQQVFGIDAGPVTPKAAANSGTVR